MPRQLNETAKRFLADSEWLSTKHCDEHWSISKISDYLGCTYGSVTKALRQFSIQSPTQQQLREAALKEKYGVTNVSQLQEVRAQVSDKLKRQSVELKARRTQTNIERYGVENSGHLFAGKNSKVGRNNHISEEQWARLDDADWLQKQHHIEKKPICTIAREIGVWDTTVATRLDKFDIKKLQFYTSQGEREISQFIRGLGFDILERKRVGGVEFDIVIPDVGLAIEYCGLYYHSERMGKDRHYHHNKLLHAQNNNLQLLTIFEDEWLHKQHIVKNIIKNKLLLSNDYIHARKCIVGSIKKEDADLFVDKFHIQGHGQSSIDYALFYGDKVVAVIQLKRHCGQLLINRYCSDIRVAGGFSKLLSYIRKRYSDIDIVTFADLRWSEGNMYQQCLPTSVINIPPDYSYAGAGCSGKRQHKFNFRHSRLKSKLANYDPSKTERQNCDQANLWRIWDCGKKKYTWNAILSNCSAKS